jgi:hypothetical protein
VIIGAWCLKAGRAILGCSLVFAGCSSPPSVVAEAEALEAQGKLEESGAKLDLACALAPGTPDCAASDAKATAVRMKAAEKAINDGKFIEAERLLRLAQLTADEAASQGAADRLAKPDLIEGLRYERALRETDKVRATKVMEAVAASGAPPAAKAKEWLDRERPAGLVEEVKAACGPERRGSCSKTWSLLQALPAKPPGFDEAAALAQEEERRIYPMRGEAERFLPVFAARWKKKEAFERCLAEKAVEVPEEHQRTQDCRGDIWEKETYERYDGEKLEETLFRRRLKAIGDPEIVGPLEERKKQAIESGVYAPLSIPKPAGGAKKP